jgi:hypothetical protein
MFAHSARRVPGRQARLRLPAQQNRPVAGQSCVLRMKKAPPGPSTRPGGACSSSPVAGLECSSDLNGPRHEQKSAAAPEPTGGGWNKNGQQFATSVRDPQGGSYRENLVQTGCGMNEKPPAVSEQTAGGADASAYKNPSSRVAPGQIPARMWRLVSRSARSRESCSRGRQIVIKYICIGGYFRFWRSRDDERRRRGRVPSGLPGNGRSALPPPDPQRSCGQAPEN